MNWSIEWVIYWRYITILIFHQFGSCSSLVTRRSSRLHTVCIALSERQTLHISRCKPIYTTWNSTRTVVECCRVKHWMYSIKKVHRNSCQILLPNLADWWKKNEKSVFVLLKKKKINNLMRVSFHWIRVVFLNCFQLYRIHKYFI